VQHLFRVKILKVYTTNRYKNAGNKIIKQMTSNSGSGVEAAELID
jgi:hypothetical protein